MSFSTETAAIHRLFELQAAAAPGAIAVDYEGAVLSYRELEHRANRLAGALAAAGIGAGERVATLVERSPEMIVSLLAILKAGAAYVPLDLEYPAERLAFMLRDSGASAVLAEERLRARLGASVPCAVLDLASLQERSAERSATPPAVFADGSSLAYVMYTSGSTGEPKGVCVPHRAISRLVLNTNYVTIGPDDRVAQVANGSFDAATFEIWGALLNGARLVGIPRECVLSPAGLAARLRAGQVSAMFLTSALFNQMIRHDPGCLSGVGTLLVGGEALNAEVIRRCLRGGPPARLLNAYGPTENTTFSTFFPIHELAEEATSVPIGHPVANSELLVLDGELRPVGAGEVGELYAGGAGLAVGYWDRPRLTAERFVPHPWSAAPGERLYATGDLGRRREDGAVEFLGRADHQVKLHGYRIELGEIEAVLASHPAVAEAAVILERPDPGDGRLVAYWVAKPGEPGGFAELRRFLARKLPAYMVPGAFVALESLPLTPNGKVDRAALRTPESLPRPPLEVVYAAPRDDLEEEVAAICAELLQYDHVGVDDNLFELGGDSLFAVRLNARLRERWGVELPLAELFEHPTVGGLRRLLAAMGAGAAPPIPIERAARDSELPLSFAQERIWFVQQLNPESRAYHFQATIRMRGPLDREALERSLDELVRRHEIFRTTFPAVDGRAVQRIHAPWAVRLPVIDLAGLAGGRDEVERQITAALQRRFDLTRLPLVRWALLALGSGDHLLWHVEHHLLHDGWSFNVFLDELAALYRAFHQGLPPPLPPPELHFADFALWQRSAFTGEEAERQLAYWRQRLAGEPGVLELPADNPRPAVQSYRGRVKRIELPAGLGRSLRAFARGSGRLTPFMVLLAGFFALLGRYSGQSDLWVACGVANRRRREAERLVGMLINAVVLRVDVADDPTGGELLERVRETTVGAYAHQELPFERLVEALRPERDLSRTPLVQVAFSMHDAPLSGFELPELEVEVVEGVSNDTAKFDLSVIAIPHSRHRPGAAEAEGITLLWEYSTDLFEPETMERMVRHYEQLLGGLLAAPSRRLSQLPLMTPAERDLLLAEWWSGGRIGRPEECLHERFAAQAERTPDLVAVSFEERQMSYRELDVRSNQLAHRLRRLGVGPDVLVAVALERSPELIIALLGILKAGGAYLPLDLDYPRQRLELMLEDAGVDLLLTGQDLVQSLPRRSAVLCLDALWPELARESAVAPHGGALPDNLAYVIYTSGSTGRPKGVLVAHRGLCNLAALQVELLQVHPGHRVLQLASIAFDASIFEIMLALGTGATLVMARREELLPGPGLTALLRRARVSHLVVTPAGLAPLPWEELPDLEMIICGAEVLSAELVRRWGDGRRFLNVYGPTEATVASTFSVCRADGRKPAIGRPIANVRTCLLDSNMEPVAPGVLGNLFLGGLGVARGYLGRPELTAERFLPDPHAAEPGARLYDTGDHARLRNDHELEYLGRGDDQVKVRGFRVDLGEVESTLARHPAVGEAAAVLRGASPGERRLVAYVTRRPQDGRTGRPESDPGDLWAELRGFLREGLPDYMMPALFVEVGELPRTPSGKLDRKALPEPPGETGRSGFVAPRTGLEAEIAEVWRQVLGCGEVGVTDNFFALGGDSILSIIVTSRLGQRGIGATAPAIFENQTIAELAQVVTPCEVKAEGVQAAARGRVPLLPAQAMFFELGLAEPRHFNQAVMLHAGGLQAGTLERALQALLDHHDALRLRFRRDAEGWSQEYPEADERVAFEVVSADGGGTADWTAAAARLHRSLDLGSGPLFRAGLFQGGAAGDRLYLVAHHLVIDLVSWRILLEDLEQAYGQALAGESVRLATRAGAVRLWAEALHRHAADLPAAELAYWREVAAQRSAGLPVELAAMEELWAETEQVTVELAEAPTRELLAAAQRAYRCDAQDVLLTALGRALGAWTGEEAVLVAMEGHGRDPLQGVEPARTVGWLTAIYAHPLPTGPGLDPGEHLKRVKEGLRRVPRRGVGYGLLRYPAEAQGSGRLPADRAEPELSFNYRGQVQRAAAAVPFARTTAPAGVAHSPGNRRPFAIQVEAELADGRLALTLLFGRRFRRETMDRLAQGCMGELTALREHCLNPANAGRTPSDFPLVALTQAEVDALPPDVEDVYPLTPIQEGLLFQILYEPDSPIYFEQARLDLEGQLQPAAYRQAWEHGVASLTALRTIFRWEGLVRPVQVVLRELQPEWASEDLRALPPAGREQRIAAYLQADRPFALDRGPLLRLALFRLEETRFVLVASLHHICLDGWSFSNVLAEVAAAYDALAAGQPAAPAQARPLRDYLAWLAGWDRQQALEFWRRELAGFAAPTPLPMDRQMAEPRRRETGIAADFVPEELAARLRGWARSRRLTLSSVVRAAWAVLLARWSDESDVVFGAMVSGRPAQLPGVESMVGPFANAVPVRARLAWGDTLAGLADRLHAAAVAARANEFCLLSEVQQVSAAPASRHLFDSFLIYENYPTHGRRRPMGGVRLVALEARELSHYDLVLGVRDEERLQVGFVYARDLFATATAERLLGRLHRLLESFVLDPLAGIWGLDLLSPAERASLFLERAGREDHPLSFQQQDMWLQGQIHPHPLLDHFCVAADLVGPLRPGALGTALQAVVDRQEALRTSFPLVDGHPVQRVAGGRVVSCLLEDLSALPPLLASAQLRRRELERLAAPFDPSGGPLVRFHLVRLDAGRHRLIVAFHHLALDMFFVGALLRQIGEAYAGALRGEAAPSAPLPLQAPDLAVWQEKALRLGALDEARAYWRQRLAGAPPPAPLRTGRQRPESRHLETATLARALPEERARQLRQFSRQRRTTPFQLVTAAYLVVLQRLTGQSDLVLAMPLSTYLPELGEAVGFFSNTLPLRFDLGGDPRISELLEQIEEAFQAAARYRQFPLTQVLSGLARDRGESSSRLPLCIAQVQAFEGRFGDLRMFGAEPNVLASGFDLWLSVLRRADHLVLYFCHSLDLFDERLIERLADGVDTVLAGMVANPEARISSCELVPAAARQELLQGRGRPRPAPPLFAHERIARMAAERPQAVAAACRGEELLYGELDARANQVAHWLRSRGAGRESRVGIFGERGLGMLTAMLGILKAGAAFVPLDPEYPEARLLAILATAGLGWIATQGSLAERSAALAAAAPSRPEPFCWDEAPAGSAWADRRTLEMQPSANLDSGTSAHDLANVFYTSGSTGDPKGVMVEHGGMLNHLEAKIELLGLDERSVVVQNASPGFDISVWQFLAPLLAGGRVVIYGDETALAPPALLQALARDGATVLETVPSFLTALLEPLAAPREGTLLLPRLSYLISNAETLPVPLCRRWLQSFPAVPIINTYGATECSDDTTHLVITSPDAVRGPRVGVGWPIPGLRIHVLDEALRLLPEGYAGQIGMAGAGVGRGYLGDPAKTARTFIPDPFSGEPGQRLYLSGDLGRWGEDGGLEFLERLDSQVKVRGYRVEPGEVEAALSQHPEVRQAAVVTASGEGRGARLVAYWVGGEDTPPQRLRAYLEERLPRYMVPDLFVRLAALPLTRHGKIDRQALPALAEALGGGAAGEDHAPPRTADEVAIAAVWREVLGAERVGVDDNFFDLGGDSISSIRIAMRMRQTGLEVAVRDIFRHPTVGELARLLRDREAPAVPEGAPVAPPAARPLPAPGLAEGELEELLD